MNPENIDLAAVAAELHGVFGDTPLRGYAIGRTALRDALVARRKWSQLDAERIVDTMVAQGFLQYEGDPTTAAEAPSNWRINRR